METIGIISDTHCRLSEGALRALRGEYDSDQIMLHAAIDADDDEAVPSVPLPCDLIVYAGDVGYPSDPCAWILDDLEEIAPVVVVAGNCDWPDAFNFHGKPLPQYAAFTVEGVRFAVLHKPRDLREAVYGGGSLNPAYIMPEPRVLIHGHTHALRVDVTTAGAITLCPGSPTLPRGGNPPTVAIVRVEEPGRVLSIDIIEV